MIKKIYRSAMIMTTTQHHGFVYNIYNKPQNKLQGNNIFSLSLSAKEISHNMILTS